MKGSKGTHDLDGSELDNKTISLHDQFSTQLSLSSSNDVIMNRKDAATSLGTDKEIPSAIPHWPLKSVKQDATEEEVIKWRLQMNGFPFILSDSECGDSSYDSSLSEQSSIISSPCVSFTIHSDTQSEDLDRTDIWVSSLDLDAEDSALLPDKEQFMDIFSSDFPSPSFSTVRSLQFCPSSSSPGTSQREKANDSDEPIFWPLERASYNSPEFDKFLSVSPRRNTMDIGYAEVHHLNPILQRLHKNKLSSGKKNIEPRRGTVSLDAKGTRASQDKIQKAASVPSRLSRTIKASSKHQQVSNFEKKRPPHLKIGTPGKVRSPQLWADNLPRREIEAGNIQNVADKKSPIEELIGLDEFDGHEGISSDSSDYQFSLWLSPR
ncbi:uncharacterized protein LOC133906730 isoform X1 [Phragmites australis]|uniref:uncharacterized protein LOC133906730 isoform X1 n=1 Tax=Phragmites australis TaxID=29695 RepID=UPI002D7A35DC|nr:uncharacterized protein LOC133906730 isoform X1 [Phragmites australis]XP_062204695.1 uncharacterized protein LOC133906730 isoform X1 [Phragmites australis]